jgi:ParB family chromosome partitioning protein
MTTTKIIHQSNSNEWFTPKPYVEAARSAMGRIDIDPASCAKANETVRATRYLTQSDNGLKYKWRGNVWLNPPYGKNGSISNQALWSNALIKQFSYWRYTEKAVLLVNAQTGEKWFKNLWDYHICFTNHRIRFIDEWGYENNQPTHSNALVGFGIPLAVFRQHFSRFGEIVPARALRLDMFISAVGLGD